MYMRRCRHFSLMARKAWCLSPAQDANVYIACGRYRALVVKYDLTSELWTVTPPSP